MLHWRSVEHENLHVLEQFLIELHSDLEMNEIWLVLRWYTRKNTQKNTWKSWFNTFWAILFLTCSEDISSVLHSWSYESVLAVIKTIVFEKSIFLPFTSISLAELVMLTRRFNTAVAAFSTLSNNRIVKGCLRISSVNWISYLKIKQPSYN